MANDKGPDDIVIDAAIKGTIQGAVPADCVAVILYTTFPSREAAVNVGRLLVEGQFAGCVNILAGMTSVYVWNGVTEVADEAVLLAKMPPAAFDGAARQVLALHPYETPAMLALPVVSGSEPYLAWLREGTRTDR